MKVAIIGANGKTGYQTILKALDLGHEVTAVVRNPASVRLSHERLQVKRADIMSGPTSLAAALAGQEAVISAVGTSSGLNKVVTLYSKGTANIVQAMKRQGVQRLICISSIGIDREHDPNISFVFQDVLFPLIFSNSATDMRAMEQAVSASGLTWTVVRPAGLVNRLPTWEYRIAIGPSLPRCYIISRADVADFMVKALADEKYYCQTVALAS
jgi:biliverdin reductase / flavin reductase